MATHASLATQASRDLDKVKKQKSDRLKAALVQAEDTLKPDAEEEAVHILIDDDFAFTTQDVVALVRLRQPTNTGLEEHVDIDELEADSSPLNSPLNSPMRPGLAPRKKRGRHQQLHARFIVFVLGRREGVITSEYKRKQHDQHVEVCVEVNQCRVRPWLGRAVRNRHRHAIEQAPRRWRDRAVNLIPHTGRDGRRGRRDAPGRLRRAGGLQLSRAKDLLDAIDHRLKALRVLPQTSRPSSKTVDRRAKRIFDQLAKLKEEEENEKEGKNRRRRSARPSRAGKS